MASERRVPATKASRAERDRRISNLWLACWTAEEIANEVGIPVSTVKEVWPKTEESPFPSKPDKSAAEHATDFEPPIYNVWKQRCKSEGDEWQQHEQRIAAEANRKRSAATKAQARSEKGHFGATTPVVGHFDPPPVTADPHAGRTTKARLARVGPATVKRGDTLASTHAAARGSPRGAGPCLKSLPLTERFLCIQTALRLHGGTLSRGMVASRSSPHTPTARPSCRARPSHARGATLK
ncbi:MAG: hypothetical protein WD009_10325 [Phycisphaeraceae bacterium]